MDCEDATRGFWVHQCLRSRLRTLLAAYPEVALATNSSKRNTA
jgi:hypothetical protein